MQERPAGYSGAAKWLHWIMAIIVLGLIPMGIALDKLPEGPIQDRAYNLHRSFGILVLAFAVARVIFRRAYGAPTPYSGLTKFERIVSTAVHHSLYVLIFLVPMAGWLWMSTYRAEVSIFGLFILPNLLPQNETLSAFFGGAHKVLALLMAALLIAHAGGALMHAFVKRDGVLHRMLPDAWGPALDRLQSALGKPNRS